ncbi:MAG: acetyltransferase [Bacillus sp. (in: firmicutes)]
MKDKLLIIGAGGHGKVVADVAANINKWKEISFLDDSSLEQVNDFKIIGSTSNFSKYLDDYELFVALGDNIIRFEFYQELEVLGASIPTLIHPQSIISNKVKIGRGTVVMAGAIVNVSTVIGKGCIINTGATIDHDNYIEDFVHISPGVHLAGAVTIGAKSWVGIGSTVKNNISIAKESTVGAGSVVIKDLTEPGIYVGVPTRRV